MKRVQISSGEGEAEKEEKWVEKSRRGVLVWKREGPSSPVFSWASQPRLQSLDPLPHTDSNNIFNKLLLQTDSRPFRLADLVSSRKLAAALWECYQYYHCPHLHTNMHRAHLANGDARLRRHHHPQLLNDKNIDKYLADPSPASPRQPDSSSSLRRHVVSSMMQQHRSVERNNYALQPVSPTSIGSSMEIAPYDPAMTPTSSMDFKRRIGEPNYSLKTSTQLLKVLNRIWSLEEQHSSNTQLVKALKMELDHARMKIKDLLRDRQTDRHEIDDLMKQIAEDKSIRKSKEHDRVHAAVQSVKDELEDERRLRRRSESLHRKLGREVSEVKASLAGALKELERERSEKKLLENLCDEFAKGIKEYEQEVHVLRQRSGWADRTDSDRLILHISESWLDERMQMQLEAETGFADKKSIVDKLSLEIDTFLKAKQRARSSDNLVVRNRRSSLESMPLNDTVSAPHDAGDEDDSAGSDSNCFELQKTGNRGSTLHEAETGADEIHETLKPDHIKKRPLDWQRNKSCSPSGLQVKFEEQMAWAMSKNEDRNLHVVDMEEGKSTNRKPMGMRLSEKSEREAAEDGVRERKNKLSELHEVHKNHLIDDLIRSQMMVSDSINTGPDIGYGEASCSNSGWRNQASPVRQWMTEITSQDLVTSETCKPTSGGNTLKAKLLEARTKGQRSRLKTQKGSF